METAIRNIKKWLDNRGIKYERNHKFFGSKVGFDFFIPGTRCVIVLEVGDYIDIIRQNHCNNSEYTMVFIEKYNFDHVDCKLDLYSNVIIPKERYKFISPFTITTITGESIFIGNQETLDDNIDDIYSDDIKKIIHARDISIVVLGGPYYSSDEVNEHA